MSDDLGGFSLMELFREEAAQNMAVLTQGLLALELGSQDPARIEPLMRAAHSLKGAARIVGLDPAVGLAHAMEDGFVAVQEGRTRLSQADVDTLLRGVDLLGEIARIEEGGVGRWLLDSEGSLEAVIQSIRRIASGKPVTDTVSKDASAPSDSPAGQAVAAGILDLNPPGEAEVAIPTSVAREQTIEPRSSPTGDESRGSESVVPPTSRSLGVEISTETVAVPGKPASEPTERVVRVTAESMSRLMGLAGESLVQSKQVRPFVDNLFTLRTQISQLESTLQAVQDQQAAGVDGIASLQTLVSRARHQAAMLGQGLSERMEAFEDFARRNEDLAGRLHREVLTSRMRPLIEGVRGFPRMVRDVARQLGKQVRYELDGESTGVDRDILDKLEAPLNHLIRNALDHAIERPEERRAAGKPEIGRIRLEARHRAGHLQIILSDDGRGIDLERLKAKIIERALATRELVARLSEPELLEFLFLPGFSTRDTVTELSGRGVGLDVVQNMVRTVGGVVRVATTAGRGTRFILQLPISMSVIRALLVRISGEPYAFPLNRIDRILMLDPAELRSLEGREHFLLDDQPVALVEGAQVLERANVARPTSHWPVVVASDRSHRFGIVVDEFLGERDLEVRPLDPRLGKVPNLNSASILEDGWPVLIVDVEDLVQSVDNLLTGRRLRRVATEAEVAHAKRTRRVLVVDDSLTVRELERQLLESHGYEVEIAVDGVDGWNAVRSGEYDLVISDVDMPRMDGIAFIARIKGDAHLKGIPVVIVSYKDREEDRMRGLDAGANAYLTKSSFHDQTFLRTVVDLIGEARG